MGKHFRKSTFVDRLIRLPAGHRRLVLVLWLLAATVAAVVSVGLPGKLSGGGWTVTGSDSAKTAQALLQGFAGRGATTVTVVVRDVSSNPAAEGFRARAIRVIDEVAADRQLAVSSRFGWADLSVADGARYASADGRTVTEELGLGLDDGAARRELPGIQSTLTQRYQALGLSVTLVGSASFWGQVNALSASGLAKAEMVTFPLLLLILVLLYGGAVAALVSMVVAGTSIAFTSAVLSVIADHVQLSVFVENTATMLGLGIGVDYSLFVISRFKEQLRRGQSVDEALQVSMKTSGHTVLASGLTVVIALATLFLMPLNVIQSIALGGAVVVGFSVFVTVVLLPVLLRTLGTNINRGRLSILRKTGLSAGSRWHTVALVIMRRPVRFLLVSAGLLVLLGIPALRMQTFTPDARILPPDSAVRTGYDQVSTGFGAGATAPIQVVLSTSHGFDSGATGQALVQLRNELAALPGVTRVSSALDVGDPSSPAAARLLDPLFTQGLPADGAAALSHFLSADRKMTVLEVNGTDYAASPAAENLLNSVRSTLTRAHGPWQALVGGETAESVDSNQVIQDHLLQVVLVMLAVVYLLLLIVFRSIFLPLKAILMNLLSLGATYGVLVLVFQDGIGAALLGEQKGQVQNFVPVLLLALLFSLSTDYEVFLLGRIREEYVAGGDNERSVAQGVAGTAPLISGAAVLMVAVFGAFAFTAILPMKQLGLGMAVAIFIDATLIRLVVVPASMRLLGAWNWWPGIRPPSTLRRHRHSATQPPSAARAHPDRRLPRPPTAESAPTEPTHHRERSLV